MVDLTLEWAKSANIPTPSGKIEIKSFADSMFVKSKGICANLKSFWKKTTLKQNADGTWTASQELDASGKWTAFFVHMEYEGPKNVGDAVAMDGRRRLDWPISEDGRYQATTTVSIIPQTFPYADCHGDGCLGVLV